MPIESNTPGDFGPNTTRKPFTVRDHKNKQTRTVGPPETNKDKMARAISKGKKKVKRAR